MNFCKDILNDNKGVFSVFDGILAISLVFILLLSFSAIVNIDNYSLSYEIADFKSSNDVLQLMNTKFDENSYSILENIVFTIENTDNSYESRKKIAIICEEFLNNTIPNNGYLFVENNNLNDPIITSKGDISSASNISSATRTVGNYSFTLYIF